jgi:hypothetical protein
LYIKDPIGKIYYAEEDFFRENIAVSAFSYAKVKSLFRETYDKIQKVPKFENYLNFGNFSRDWDEPPQKPIAELNVEEVEQMSSST